jgi:hypothetical protein
MYLKYCQVYACQNKEVLERMNGSICVLLQFYTRTNIFDISTMGRSVIQVCTKQNPIP